jgi:NAD(P)-dependent dehydrogenase (short-subunit alcohol dehydrogenase family)
MVVCQAARAVDLALEATVAPSFSRLGYEIRSRLPGWQRLDGQCLRGKTCLVTGASSGIGLAAAVGLAGLGAAVMLVGRDARRLADAADAVVRQVPGADVRPLVADMNLLSDVRRLATQVDGGQTRLDVLVHNASTLEDRHRLSQDGIEVTAQVSLVAPFLLTALLREALGRSPDPRLITVSSGGMYTRRLRVDDLDAGPAGFRGADRYALCKRAQVTLTRLWAERLADGRITAVSMHPGWVDTPGLARSLPRFHTLMRPLLRRPEQGADTIVWLAASALPPGSSGRFWHDRRARSIVRLPRTVDLPGEADRLWAWCAARAGLPVVDGGTVVDGGAGRR